jgi:hypothetical protein
MGGVGPEGEAAGVDGQGELEACQQQVDGKGEEAGALRLARTGLL